MPGGNRCSVAVCKSHSTAAKSSGMSIMFFTFPKDTKIKNQWVEQCHRNDKWNPNSGRICSRHFVMDDYEDALKAELLNITPKKLKLTAVPSQNLLPADTITSNTAVSKPKKRPTKFTDDKNRNSIVECFIKESSLHQSQELPNEMANYMEYKLIGTDKKMRMVDGCLPSKFECQSDGRKKISIASTPRSAVIKRCELSMISESEHSLEESTSKEFETIQIKPEVGVMANIKTEVLDDVKIEMKPDDKSFVKLNCSLNQHDDQIKIEETTLQPYINDATVSLDENDVKKEIRFEEVNECKPLIVSQLDNHRCSVCAEEFDDAKSLKEHSNTHTSQKTHTCDVCQKVFTLAHTLRYHKLVHSFDPPFECDMCDKKFYMSSRLKVHQRVHSGERPFKCVICGKQFTQNKILAHHIIRHANDEKCLWKLQPTDGRYKCDLCEKSFLKRKPLMLHQRMHSGAASYDCDLCEKKFTQLYNLTVHKRLHNADKRVSCDICKKKYNRRDYLRRHMRKHTNERPFSCDVCDKKFFLQKDLRTHRVMHTGERPYECDVCKMAFYRKEALWMHKLKHPGGPRFHCDFCDKIFVQKRRLTLHRRVHTGERPYECDVCKLAFSRKDTLKMHEMTHSSDPGFSCDLCEKTFATKNRLTLHKRIHSDDRPYKCGICGKAFTQKAILTPHLKRHAEQMVNQASNEDSLIDE